MLTIIRKNINHRKENDKYVKVESSERLQKMKKHKFGTFLCYPMLLTDQC